MAFSESKYRQAVELKNSGKSYEEIATQLGYKSKGSIAKLLSSTKFKNSLFQPNYNPLALSRSATLPPNEYEHPKPENLNSYIFPIQFNRTKADILYWRQSVSEAELQILPFRVMMQRIYQDVINDADVDACVSTRKDFILLKEHGLFYESAGEWIEDESASLLFKKPWFKELLSFILDSIFYGYSLISLGDIVNNEFPKLTNIRRWLISPDRFELVPIEYMIGGVPFLEAPYSDWSVYVDTPTETGATRCGYGLFYKVAQYYLFLRNNTGFNADFVEKFAMPLLWAQTIDSNETERGKLEQAAQNLGNNGYLVTDINDKITLLESKSAGTGHQSYGSFDESLRGKISKLILGHKDAIDSIPGRLGNQQANDNTPPALAMQRKEIHDSHLCENVINNTVIPKLQALGLPIKGGLKWMLKNDKERQEIREHEDNDNLVTMDIVLAANQAGYEVDPAYITERTGIPLTKKATVIDTPDAPDNLPELDNDALNRFYERHKSRKNKYNAK